MPACLPARSPFPSLARSTPPPRYRYHNNENYRDTRSLLHDDTMPRGVAARRSGRSGALVDEKQGRVRPDYVYSTAAFSALNFAEAHSAIEVGS